MISQEAAVSSAHLQLDLFHGFTHQRPTQMEPEPTVTHLHTAAKALEPGQTHT